MAAWLERYTSIRGSTPLQMRTTGGMGECKARAHIVNSPLHICSSSIASHNKVTGRTELLTQISVAFNLNMILFKDPQICPPILPGG